MNRIVQVHSEHCQIGSIVPIPIPGIGEVDPPPFYGVLNQAGMDFIGGTFNSNDRLRKRIDRAWRCAKVIKHRHKVIIFTKQVYVFGR